MSQSQAVVRTAGADKPTLDYDPQDRHMTVLKNGPGMHLNIAFSAGGVYAEAACRKGAILLGLGPYAASEAIVQLFGDDAKRLEILNELFRLRGHPAAEQIDGIDGTAKLQAPAKPSKAVQKLKKLCGRVFKYTHECVALNSLIILRISESKTQQERVGRHSTISLQMHRDAYNSLYRLTMAIHREYISQGSLCNRSLVEGGKCGR